MSSSSSSSSLPVGLLPASLLGLVLPSPSLSSSSSSFSSFSSVRIVLLSGGVAFLFLASGKLNSMTQLFFREFRAALELCDSNADIRCIVVASDKQIFTAGLDLKEAAALLTGSSSSDSEVDVARSGFAQRTSLIALQECFSVMERIKQPVIAAINGACIGGGIDLISSADIRLASKDANFSVKEIDIGLAADLGTLQRLPRIIGSRSLVNELCLTARTMESSEALSCGLVSRVLPDRDSLLTSSFDLAKLIAQKSPVAATGTKHLLVRSRDMSVADGLNYTAAWNACMLQTNDIPAAVAGTLSKKPAVFAKL